MLSRPDSQGSLIIHSPVEAFVPSSIAAKGSLVVPALREASIPCGVAHKKSLIIQSPREYLLSGLGQCSACRLLQFRQPRRFPQWGWCIDATSGCGSLVIYSPGEYLVVVADVLQTTIPGNVASRSRGRLRPMSRSCYLG